jgi:hypothetical protein
MQLPADEVCSGTAFCLSYYSYQAFILCGLALVTGYCMFAGVNASFPS